MAKTAWLGPVILLLAACAATPYQASDQQGYGYQEQQIAAGVYDVMFVANTATGQQEVEDLALLRAAELGVILGYSSLVVASDKGGIITLADHSGPGQPPDMPSPMPNARDAGMSMGRGGSGGYGSTSTMPASYTVNSSRSGGNPARACVLRVRFYKQGDGAAGPSAQDIPALVTRLRAAYGIAAPAGGH